MTKTELENEVKRLEEKVQLLEAQKLEEVVPKEFTYEEHLMHAILKAPNKRVARRLGKL